MNIENLTSLGTHAENITFFILVQIVIILIFSRVISFISSRLLGQTNAAGEILAGILLGPSFLSSMFPEFLNAIFINDTSYVFVGFSQIGLIFLMFQIGMEFDFYNKMKGERLIFLLISFAGIVFPFFIGFFSSEYLWNALPEPRPNLLGFKLFFAISMSITAIPILGRIFMELNYSHTRIATIIISSAAIDDVIGWLLLGVVTALVTSNFDSINVIKDILLLLTLGFTIFLIGSKWLSVFIGKILKSNQRITSNAIFYIIVCLFISAIITSYLGVYAIIGGFILGLSLNRDRNFVYMWNSTIGVFINVFFLPLFFAYTGLKTDIGLLSTFSDILLCLIICVIAFISKFGGTYITSRFLGESHINSLIIGFSMNTRALMELIVLNVGYDLGLLPQKIFTMLVIMAVISTFIVTPILKNLLQKVDR